MTRISTRAIRDAWTRHSLSARPPRTQPPPEERPMRIDGITPGQRHHPVRRLRQDRRTRHHPNPQQHPQGDTMWLLILAALWAPILGAACTVIWWPQIREWLGAPPQEMDEQDWVELAAAMNRHPAGKHQPGTPVQITAPMTTGPGGIIITPEENHQ